MHGNAKIINIPLVLMHSGAGPFSVKILKIINIPLVLKQNGLEDISSCARPRVRTPARS